MLVGDLNAEPGDPTINALEAQGFLDTFVEANNPACDPDDRYGVHERTPGRRSLGPDQPRQPRDRTHRLRPAEDRDGSARWQSPPASSPRHRRRHRWTISSSRPITPGCRRRSPVSRRPAIGPRPDRSVGRRPAPPPRRLATRTVDPETAAAVTTSFETVFNGGGAIESRLTSLQDADQLRESFIARYEDPAIKDVVDQVTVRIDSMSAVDDDHVNVVYSILLGSDPGARPPPGRGRARVRPVARLAAQLLPGRDPGRGHRARGLPLTERAKSALTWENSTLVGRTTQE